MTSTLYVDNLIEKTSGNGVHIPGHVINYQKYTFSSYATSNSTNYVLIRSGTYTPKIVGSKVLIQTYGRMSVDPGTAISLHDMGISIDGGSSFIGGHEIGGAFLGEFTSTSTNAVTIGIYMRKHSGVAAYSGNCYFGSGGVLSASSGFIVQEIAQ
jgi:hypothetical protein